MAMSIRLFFLSAIVLSFTLFASTQGLKSNKNGDQDPSWSDCDFKGRCTSNEDCIDICGYTGHVNSTVLCEPWIGGFSQCCCIQTMKQVMAPPTPPLIKPPQGLKSNDRGDLDPSECNFKGMCTSRDDCIDICGYTGHVNSTVLCEPWIYGFSQCCCIQTIKQVTSTTIKPSHGGGGHHIYQNRKMMKTTTRL